MGDVTCVVRETLEVLEPHASEQGFALELHAESDLPAVRFDRDALAQVLFNLVDNALKYGSEAAERTVAIHCERAGEGGRDPRRGSRPRRRERPSARHLASRSSAASAS